MSVSSSSPSPTHHLICSVIFETCLKFSFIDLSVYPELTGGLRFFRNMIIPSVPAAHPQKTGESPGPTAGWSRPVNAAVITPMSPSPAISRAFDMPTMQYQKDIWFCTVHTSWTNTLP